MSAEKENKYIKLNLTCYHSYAGIGNACSKACILARNCTVSLY